VTGSTVEDRGPATATFSMEFLKYQRVPVRLQEEVVKKAQEEAKAVAKA